MLGGLAIGDAAAQPAEPKPAAAPTQQGLEGVSPLQSVILHGGWRADSFGIK